MKKRTVHIVISCDADPDRPKYGGAPLNKKESHKWEGIQKGIPQLKAATKDVKDTFNNNVKISWFLRSDTQMNDIYEDYSWPAANFKELWKGLQAEGDEIAWHPHLWRWNEQHNHWFQELSDEAWIRNCYSQGYASLKKHFDIKTTRTGWDFHNNLTMNLLNDLGIVADLSAMPGFKSRQVVDEKSGLPHNYYDWIGVTNEIYHPSRNDYKMKGDLSIIEIPHACYYQNYWIYAFKKGLWKTPLKRVMDKRPLRSYALMISLESAYFREGTKHFFKKNKAKYPIFVSYFHPDDLLDMEGKEGFKAIIRNLNIICEISKDLNIPFKFVTASEAASIAKEQIGHVR